MQTLSCTVTSDSMGKLSYRETLAMTFCKANAAGEPRRVPCMLRIKVDSGKTRQDCKAKVQRYTDGRWITLERRPRQLVATHAGEYDMLSDAERDLLPLTVSDEATQLEQGVLELFREDRGRLLGLACQIMAIVHGGEAQPARPSRAAEISNQVRRGLAAVGL